jgi:TM2 domain-containing membrane protein YozV
VCIHCGYNFNQAAYPQPQMIAQPQQLQEASSKKLAAGLCGIFLGSLGIHKFVLGYNKTGIIMLLVTLLTCGIGAAIMHVIGIVEGIIYLTKSDQQFYNEYMAGQKDWF